MRESSAHSARRGTGRLAVFALILACAGSAWGQAGELWFSVGESLLSSGLGGNTPNDYHFGDGFRFGFRFGFNPQKFFGHEVQYAYSRTHLNSDSAGDIGGMAIHQGGYNFLAYAMPEGFKFRPFGTGGVHFSNYVPPGSSAASGGGETKFGFNYGGGVKVRVTSVWAVRFDVRQYTTPKPFDLPNKSGWIHQTEISGGVGFVF